MLRVETVDNFRGFNYVNIYESRNKVEPNIISIDNVA